MSVAIATRGTLAGAAYRVARGMLHKGRADIATRLESAYPQSADLTPDYFRSSSARRSVIRNRMSC